MGHPEGRGGARLGQRPETWRLTVPSSPWTIISFCILIAPLLKREQKRNIAACALPSTAKGCSTDVADQNHHGRQGTRGSREAEQGFQD